MEAEPEKIVQPSPKFSRPRFNFGTTQQNEEKVSNKKAEMPKNIETQPQKIQQTPKSEESNNFSLIFMIFVNFIIFFLKNRNQNR